MNLSVFTTRNKGNARCSRLRPLRCLVFAVLTVVVLASSNQTHAISWGYSVDIPGECSTVSPMPGVMGCLVLDQVSHEVSYHLSLTNFASTINSATVYKHLDGDPCGSLGPIVETLCNGDCDNPLHGTYTLTEDQQDDMMISNHIIYIDTTAGYIWMEIDKGPPGYCIIVTRNEACTAPDPKPTVIGGLTLDATGKVKFDISINPFYAEAEATAKVCVEADDITCTTEGTTLVTLCAQAGSPPECTNPLQGTYDLDAGQRAEMLAGLHDIIITWEDYPDREVWIDIGPYCAAVPTVSEWGLIAMGALLIGVGVWIWANRRARGA